jgi:hypothetical protein
VTDSVDKGTGEDGCQEIAKSVTLLQHTGDNTTSSLRAVLESWKELDWCDWKVIKN